VSLRRTNLPVDRNSVLKAVKKALTEHPVSGDLNFAILRKANASNPVIVKDDEGKDAFWLVPLLSGEKAVGFVRLEKNLRVSQVGIFGASAADRESWVDASFFDRPPPEAINSIRVRYPDMKMSDPVFSFDKSPAKWGWLIALSNNRKISIFVTPSGWHEKTSRNIDFEG
jgi:hypothetical protein